METNRDLIVSIATNIHYAKYFHKPPFKNGESTEFYLNEIEKVDKWLWEDFQNSGIPNYKVRYVVENAGWSFLILVEKDNEWHIIYDHSNLKMEIPDWLN